MDGTPRGFAQRLLALLDQASVATTYKYALLLAIMDACLDGTDAAGRPPDRVEVADLAERTLRLYWPHTEPYPDTGEVLRQSGTGQAELLKQIGQFRGADASERSTFAAARYATGFDRLVDATAWKLAEMPLPRLQRVGNVNDPFLYDISWDESITRRAFSADAFDRAIYLRPNVASDLVLLAPLVRPLVERMWAQRVVTYNRLPDGRLDQFLFRRSRLDAVRLRLALLELQEGRCFYTGRRMQPSAADVDHFLPWSRSPLETVENLVVADRRANNNKRDHLAAADLVVRWRNRNRMSAGDLARIATANRWESAPTSTVGVARALYFALDATNMLWAGPGSFVRADVATLRSALAVN